MAKVTLDIDSNAFAVFSQTETAIDGLRAGVSTLSKEGTNAFKKVTDEANSMTDEIKKGSDSTGDFVDELIKAGKTSNVIKELKKQVKEYESAALRAGEGTKAFKENLEKAGALKDKINDLTAATKSLTGNIGENLARAAGNSIGLIATGMEGAASAQVLLGDKSKEFEETLLRLQALNGIANVTREFAGIGDKLTEIKLGFAPVLDLYTSGNAKIKDFAKNADFSFKGLKTGIKDFASGAVSGFKSFASAGVAGIKSVGAAIAANPLGVVLVIVAAVIGAMVLLKDKVKPIADLFEFLGDVVDAVGDAFDYLLEVTGLAADASDKAAQSMIDGQEEAIAAIEKRYDRELKLLQAAGKNTDKTEKEKLKAVQARVLESIKALEYKRLKEGELDDDELKKQKENIQKVIDLQVDFAAIDVKAAKEAADKKEEERKKYSEKVKQLEKDLQSSLSDLAKRAQAAELESLTGAEKLKKQKEINEKDLNDLRELIIKKGQLLDASYKLTASQEQEFSKIKTQINRDYYDGLLALSNSEELKRVELEKKSSESELANLEFRYKIAENNIEKKRALESTSASEQFAFEQSKAMALLFNQLDYEQKKIDLVLKGIEAEKNLKQAALEAELKTLEGRTDAISTARANAIKTEIDSINISSELAKQAAMSGTDNIIKGIEDKIAELQPKKINLSKLFNLDETEIAATLNVKFNAKVNPSDVQNAKDALQQLVASLKEILNAYFEAEQERLNKELDANSKRIESRDTNIQSLKDTLEKEKSLQDQGLANNVERIKKAIEEQENARQKDLEKEKEIKKEKQKLAKQQLIIDTITQASQLTLAIAQLYGALSSFVIGPVPVGVIIATATSAAMTGAFIAGKKKAFDAVNSGSQGFFKGGYTGDGNPFDEAGVVHKKEFVNTADDTKKYRPLFEGIHTKNKKLIEIGVRDLLENTGVVLSDDIGENLSNRKQDAKTAEYHASYYTDNSGIESRLDKHGRILEDILSENRINDTILPNGDRVIRKGNTTRIIRAKNDKI